MDLERFTAQADEIKAWRHALHQRPELAFKERWTSDFIAEKLTSFGYEVSRGLGGTGVVATCKGSPGPAIGLRADMDALPIHEVGNHAHASQNPGCMHACGHDGHSAMLLAAARHFAEAQDVKGVIHFIFQPAEEGEAGARAMIQDGLFEQHPMEYVFGLHNFPGIPEGLFEADAGPQMAAFDIIDIAVRGPGGHAAMPHQTNDALLAAAALVQASQAIVSRAIDPQSPAVVSLTAMQGGDAYNVLPAEVRLKGCARYLDQEAGETIRRRLVEICSGIGKVFDVKVELDHQVRYPATVNDARATAIALSAATQVAGPERVNGKARPRMASEDFAFMLQERPGCYMQLGAGEAAHPLHTPDYDFNDALLATGAAYWVAVAREALAQLAGE